MLCKQKDSLPEQKGARHHFREKREPQLLSCADKSEINNSFCTERKLSFRANAKEQIGISNTLAYHI